MNLLFMDFPINIERLVASCDGVKGDGINDTTTHSVIRMMSQNLRRAGDAGDRLGKLKTLP